MEKSSMRSPELNSLPSNPIPLSTQFYHGDTLDIARNLLGKGLYRKVDGEVLLAEICEVEAYLGTADPASHTFRGLSKRNAAMFEGGGTCYVYLSYGLNYCMNVVTQEKGLGEAVLLRAAKPILGMERMKKNRPRAKTEIQLLSGPGRLCQGFEINLQQNGWTFDRPDLKIVDLKTRVKPHQIGISARIGITKAASHPWRFFIKSSPWLSRKG
jgi:DNA-3-methyladenine glycosylase